MRGRRRGTLIGVVPGVIPANVVVIGAGGGLAPFDGGGTHAHVKSGRNLGAPRQVASTLTVECRPCVSTLTLEEACLARTS